MGNIKSKCKKGIEEECCSFTLLHRGPRQSVADALWSSWPVWTCLCQGHAHASSTESARGLLLEAQLGWRSQTASHWHRQSDLRLW
jgi:hypothetical protein